MAREVRALVQDFAADRALFRETRRELSAFVNRIRRIANPLGGE
jgi:hypothetical protein